VGSVGLLYVGAVLFVNGLMLLGRVKGTSAAPLNLFVGVLQVITPTYLIFTAGGDADTVLAASGLYLFGFTYLYVAMNLFFDLDGTGLGWFSAFVAACALVFAGLSWTRLDDPASAVLWLYWAFLWGLFWAVLGLGVERLTRYTGAVAAVQGIVTGAVPAFLLLTGRWADNTGLIAIVLAVVGVVVFGALYPRLGHPHDTTAPARRPAPRAAHT